MEVSDELVGELAKIGIGIVSKETELKETGQS